MDRLTEAIAVADLGSDITLLITLLIFVSISLVKLDQSTPFLHHLADLEMTGL